MPYYIVFRYATIAPIDDSTAAWKEENHNGYNIKDKYIILSN